MSGGAGPSKKKKNELQTNGWLHQDSEKALKGQNKLAGDDFNADDFSYKEVERQLDMLQQHFNRLESQLTADIQAILQLLQSQSANSPPAYSTVFSSPKNQNPTTTRVSSLASITGKTFRDDSASELHWTAKQPQ